MGIKYYNRNKFFLFKHTPIITILHKLSIYGEEFENYGMFILNLTPKKGVI